MTFVSYSQNLEDVMLRRALADVERGFYIDVGANDPVIDSVTKAFYDAGWRGINIEPVPAWIEKLRMERPEDINLQVAAGNEEGKLRFFEVVDTGLSTSSEDTARMHKTERGLEVREYEVMARRLDGICREHDVQEVHFLKIDAEGAERAVLEGLDLQSLRPWIILVEATLPNSQVEDSASWEPLLVDRGYHPVWFDGLNRFYVADERPDLDRAFETPPNLWDAYETSRERTLRREHRAAHARLAEALQEGAVLRSEKAELIESARHWQTVAGQRDAELAAAYGSRSWKLTRPLRLAARGLRAPPRALASYVRAHSRLEAAIRAAARRFPGLGTRLERWLSTVPRGSDEPGERP